MADNSIRRLRFEIMSRGDLGKPVCRGITCQRDLRSLNVLHERAQLEDSASNSAIIAAVSMLLLGGHSLRLI